MTLHQFPRPYLFLVTLALFEKMYYFYLASLSVCHCHQLLLHRMVLVHLQGGLSLPLSLHQTWSYARGIQLHIPQEFHRLEATFMSANTSNSVVISVNVNYANIFTINLDFFHTHRLN